MNYFIPQDHLSETLLKSIPRKIFHWLSRLEIQFDTPGNFKKLSWDIIPDAGSLEFIFQDSKITISWFGESDIRGSDKRFCNLSQHLDWFMLLEKEIYDTLEEYEKYLTTSDFNPIPPMTSSNAPQSD